MIKDPLEKVLSLSLMEEGVEESSNEVIKALNALDELPSVGFEVLEEEENRQKNRPAWTKSADFCPCDEISASFAKTETQIDPLPEKSSDFSS